MKATITYSGKEITITTEHSASSYGKPVVLINGELRDIPVDYEQDEQTVPSLIDYVADSAGIHNGPATRRRLYELEDEMFPNGLTTGTEADQVCAEFKRRGAELRKKEADEDFIAELDKRSMSSWTDEELKRYSILTGQEEEPCQ